ncbi:hypothetical protein ABB02_00720 [Clostridiaceae bacterium JG1575]|nr:hypothetical protein ABB02_00720 [Clostridiaceae bacterium JG1575]
MKKQTVDVLTSRLAVQPGALEDKAVVVIDTLRATTVMVTALSYGAKKIIPVAEVEEAFSLRAQDPSLLLGGERHALFIPGFDFGNSPLEYTKVRVKDKTLIMSTSNGTRTLLSAAAGAQVFLGALRNGTAAMARALDTGRDVVLFNAGTDGALSLDDFITAGAMIAGAQGSIQLTDAARLARMLYEAHPDLRSALQGTLHYERMRALNLEADLEFCLQKDQSSLVPAFWGGEILPLR